MVFPSSGLPSTERAQLIDLGKNNSFCLGAPGKASLQGPCLGNRGRIALGTQHEVEVVLISHVAVAKDT